MPRQMPPYFGAYHHKVEVTTDTWNAESQEINSEIMKTKYKGQWCPATSSEQYCCLKASRVISTSI